MIDDVVYFSTLGGTTYGLAIKDGRVRWSTDQGRTAGVITDGEWVYLGGESELFGYVAESTKQPTGARRAEAADDSTRSKPSVAPRAK